MLNPNPSPASTSAGGASPYAAVFIDFENVYYFLKNHYLDPQDPHDYALDLLRSLRDALKTQYGLESLVLNAYADFDKLPTGPQGPLYLMGVTTRNVLGTDHKNAADMQLCIDALEVLYTRPAIGTFVLVGGDRDYIPVIQHLRRQARLVKVVGFRESVSGDLLQLLGQEHFLDARDLLPAGRLQALEDHRTARLARGEEIRRLREQGLAGVQSASARLAAQYAAQHPAPTAPAAPGTEATAALPAGGEPSAEALAASAASESEALAPPAEGAHPLLAETEVVPGTLVEEAPGHYATGLPAAYLAAGLPLEPTPAFAPIRRVVRDDARRCLEYLIEQVQKYGGQQVGVPEIWASPFLRRLTDVLPELPDWERRQLLTSLRDDGAVRIEKREGEPHAFSVIILNYQHPDVRDLMPVAEPQPPVSQ